MTTIADHLHHPKVKIVAAYAVFILFLLSAGWTFVTITYDLPNQSARHGTALSQDQRSLEAPATQVLKEH